jgi:multisubunit Na+/H+ antiporter MnhG subunit
MAREIATACILFAAMCFLLLSAIGILKSKNSLAALHCAGVSNVLIPPLTTIAVVVDVGFGSAAVKMAVLMVVLLFGAPITSHAIGVAEHRRNPRL